MGTLGGTNEDEEDLAKAPSHPGADTVKPQDGPLNRPGTEADERAGRPGVDEGTTEGLSKSS